MIKPLSLLAILMALIMVSCSDQQDPVSEQQEIQFGVNISTGSSGGRAADVPAGSKLLISISNQSGVVFTRRSVSILKMGGSYLTEPVSLPTGRFSLTEFLVVNEEDEILFAVPKTGSQLAAAVPHSLPYSFVIGKGKVNNIDMGVISTSGASAAAFGYASFGIDVINTVPVSIFIEENGQLVLTDATIFLYNNHPTGEVLDQTIAFDSKVNYVSFDINENPNWYSHIFIVEKEGYVTYNRAFTQERLLSGEPIEIVLTKLEFKMRTMPVSGAVGINMMVRGTGSLTINWGDGTSETKTFVPDEEISIPSESSRLTFDHTYSTSQEYHLMFSGDIEAVLVFDNGTLPLGELDILGTPTLFELTLRNSVFKELNVNWLHYLTINSTEIERLHFGYTDNLYDVTIIGNVSSATRAEIHRATGW
jgi:hypothetical protein